MNIRDRQTLTECWNEAAQLGLDMSQVFVEHSAIYEKIYYIDRTKGVVVSLQDDYSLGETWNYSRLDNQPIWYLLKPVIGQIHTNQHEASQAECQCNRADFQHNAGCGYMLAKYGGGWTP